MMYEGPDSSDVESTSAFIPLARSLRNQGRTCNEKYPEIGDNEYAWIDEHYH
jgi:hypothetical protein